MRKVRTAPSRRRIVGKIAAHGQSELAYCARLGRKPPHCRPAGDDCRINLKSLIEETGDEHQHGFTPHDAAGNPG